MNVVHARQPLPDRVSRTIFLAGPTPRTPEVPSWRPAAIQLLAERGFDGHVFVPEDDGGGMHGDYDAQVAWELEALRRADAILFWIPRTTDTMPGYTTNVEFGAWARSGKVVLGAPADAAKMRYLRCVAGGLGVTSLDSLSATVNAALALVGPGGADAERSAGECQVPLFVWRTGSFQAWYRAQRAAGNELLGATVEWVFRAHRAVFYWALHVDVWVTAEQRHKKNEVVLARPDIAAVVLHRGREVALIREFRSAGASADGWIREVPGGTSLHGVTNMRDVAVEEVREEAGLTVAAARLHPVAVRQLMATMSAHRAHVFAVELTAAELEHLRAQAGIIHGADAGERTTIEIWDIDRLLATPAVDWSTLGMILTVVR